MRQMKHWMLAAILTLCGTATAWAQDVSYVERSWDSENKTVVSTTKTLTSGSYTAINGNEPENWVPLADGITAGAAAGVRAFVLNFGDEASGIGEISTSRNDNMPNVGWYTLDGRRLSGRSAEGRLQGKKPIVRGLYINNGKKIIIK